MRYFLNGYEVTRWNMAQYLSSVFGGNPEALISNFEQRAVNYFYCTGNLFYEEPCYGIAIEVLR